MKYPHKKLTPPKNNYRIDIQAYITLFENNHKINYAWILYTKTPDNSREKEYFSYFCELCSFLCQHCYVNLFCKYSIFIQNAADLTIYWLKLIRYSTRCSFCKFSCILKKDNVRNCILFIMHNLVKAFYCMFLFWRRA